MVSLIVSLTSKCRHVSQQDFDIMMICMNCHDTFLALHLMIAIAFTLPCLVSSITPSLFTHSPIFLLHQPRVILQSFVPTSRAHPSRQQCLCVFCPGCGRIYVVGIGLTHH